MSTISLRPFAAAAILFATTTLAHAETAPPADPCSGKVYNADGRLCTVITANRFKQPIQQVGSSITVITAEDMKNHGVKNLAEALHYVPGVSFAQTGGFGSTTNIRLRGSDSGQVSVLINGVKVNDLTNTEGFYDFGQTLLNNVERIEVLRGPQSSIYGADTTGGVINIITKKGGAPSTNAFGEIGSHDTYHAGTGHYGSIGKFYYGVSGEHFITQGFSRIANTTERDGTRVEDFKGNFGSNLTETLSFDVNAGANHSKADLDGFASDAPGYATNTTYYGSAKANLSTFGGMFNHQLQLSHFIQNRGSNEPLGFYRFSTFDGKRTQANYMANISLRKRDVLTLGADYQHDSAFTDNTSGGVTTTGIDRGTNNKAVFAEYVHGITDEWTATLSGRHDDFQSFGTANTYRATTAYNIPSTGTTLRASYGTGFKAPSLYQLYAPIYGTSTLKPEESKGYDASIEQHFLNDRLTLNVTGFKNTYQNLINFDTATFTYQNISQTQTYGIESGASYAVLPYVFLSGNHTYLISEDKATGRDLPRRPKHSARLAVDVDVSDDARIGADYQFTSSMWDRGSGTLRDKTHGSINLNGSADLDRHNTIYLNLKNILDKDYQDIAGYNTAGFEAFVGLRSQF